MTSIINDFKTLLSLCQNQQERRKLLRDFIVIHHPDRYQEHKEQQHLLILEANELYGKTPPLAGYSKDRSLKDFTLTQLQSQAFFCRCEAYLHYHRAFLCRYDQNRCQRELLAAKNSCRQFFSLTNNASYLCEIMTLNRQIEKLAYCYQVAL